MNQNIFVPFKLRTTLLNISAIGTPLTEILKSEDPSWYSENEQSIKNCNSVRFYVHTGPIGYLMDGNQAELTNSLIVAEELQNIENVEISKLNFVGPGSITIQIGIIS